MFLYSFLLPLFLSMSYALDTTSCFEYKPNSIEVQWTAYKFTEKKGVSGKLKSVETVLVGKPQSVEDLMLATSFTIDPLSVDSGDAGRDKTLRENFFKLLKLPKISGKIVSFASNIARVELQMNGVTKAVEFKISSVAPKIQATATIDILDFAMADIFKKLHESCQELHKGKDGVSKTWSTVDLAISAEPTQLCKKADK